MNGDGKLDIALVSDPLPTGTAGVLLGRGDGTFGETAYAVGHDTAAIEVGDLDGDGKLDVATVGKTSDGIGKLSVLLGKGDGTLAAPTDYGLPGTPSLVRLADVNGDGRLDVVSASSDVTTVTVLLGKGGGTFTNVASDADSQPRAMALGDVDGDGKLDLVIVHADETSGAGSATVLLGRGDGTFAPNSAYPVCNNPQSVASGDLDGDGQLDMVVACSGWAVGNWGVTVLLRKDDGTFVTGGDYFLGWAYGMSSVAIGDLNDDGKLDLAVADSDVIDGIRVLLGNGDGTFAEPVEFTTPWFASRIALVDINHDGKLDVVTQDDNTSSWGGAAITVLLGNGDGTLAPEVDYPVGAQGLAFGDMNGDGRLDLVAATHSNAVNVLLGACR